MSKSIKISALDISRRTLLQGVAVAGLAPVLVMHANAASGKVSQVSVAYQNKPKGDQSCANCSLFEPPAACKSVDGTVSPNGWCKIWVKKPG